VADSNKNDQNTPITIKKYANRRLYNTATSSYVTLDHLADMVKKGIDFVVYDAKSGEDITRSVLTQIIFDAEAKGQNLLPISFLRRLIGFYDDSLQSVLPSFLDMSMESFANNQDQMRQNLESAMGEPFRQIDEMNRRNLEAFQRSMSMFNPFLNVPEKKEAEEAANDGKNAEISELKSQLDQMQQQLDALLRRDR